MRTLDTLIVSPLCVWRKRCFLATWRELQARFFALHQSEKNSEYLVRPFLSVMIVRNEVAPPQLEFSGGIPPPYFRQNFKQVATDAGTLLGKCPEAITPLEHWIEGLLSHCLREQKEYLSTQRVEVDGSAQAIYVVNALCEASATFCAWLDVQAIEKASLGSDGALHRSIARAVDSLYSGDKIPLEVTPPALILTRTRIDNFIAEILGATGKKVNRTDIWLVAGYQDRSEFERFQRDDQRTTKAARIRFGEILSLAPSAFLERLAKHRR